MLKKVVNIVNRILPKKNIILLNSFPDISGNPFMLYRYMTENKREFLQDYRIIWSINGDDVHTTKKLLEKVSDYREFEICKKKSLSGLWKFCSSKYVITTHNYITDVRCYGKQKHFNLWHGMPFKAIGNMVENGGKGDVIQADYTLATSKVFQKIMSKALGLPEECIMVTGQPCNDILFLKNDCLAKLGIEKNNYRKIIIWMPTYRKSMVGSLREDGDANAFGVAEIYEKHFEELTSILQEQNILLIIKPHPMDAICKMPMESSTFIKVFQNKHLDEAGVILYELLAESDVLFTDYSSVFIDYLNLDRPIAFVCDDVEVYSENRGFCFEPVGEYLPGEMIKNYEELKLYLRNMDSLNERWNEKRKKINQIFNQYSDNLSSKRVFDYIFEAKNRR